ncbi:hypothetical protein RQP46_003455 [Phenoliferia psychrophenolica]
MGSTESTIPTPTRPSPVLPHALKLPLFNKLASARVVLASSSPRRLDILRTFGLAPEVVPSTFPEKLSHADYPDAGQYAVATATAKGVEVYERLVQLNPEDPPDLVISADTIVVLPPPSSSILEKPRNIVDQYSMLQDYNGSTVEVITAVTLVQPQIANPGYSLASLVNSTTVIFADSPPELLRAYVDSNEGIDRAGGFAIQGLGGMLIKEIKGDYNNCVGFPAQAFFEWLAELTEEGSLLEMD